MDETGSTFRAWIDRQSIAGATAIWQSKWRANFALEGTNAFVTFLPYIDEREIVELRVQRSPEAKPSFLTHFVLDDIWRARTLFREMADALKTEANRTAYKVLVCYKRDKLRKHPAPAFVELLREEASVLSVAFDFVPTSLDKALAVRDSCTAIMLMPSVSSHQKTLHRMYPNSVVLSVPESLVVCNDARKAIRLMLEGLGEIDTLTPATPPVPPARVPKGDQLVLIANVMYCDRCVRIGWRAFKGVSCVASGKVTKLTLTMKDFDDLFSTLFLYGICMSDIKALGILVPGVVNYCSMNLPSLGDRDNCIVDKLKDRYHIPVFIENNTNAAAMGCYLLQDKYESLSLYRHQLGHMNGGQGTVIGGHLVTGRYGMAGEPKFYQRKFCYEHSYSEEIWTEKGIAHICKNVILATIGTIEPDAIYVAINSIEDIEDLHKALQHALPKYCLPELFAIDDYRERMYLGGAALALERMEE